MIQLYYFGMFVISLICAAIYIYIWHKHFDVNFTMIFTLIPIANIGYLMTSMSTSVEGSLRSVQIVYIGGCFLHLFILYAIFSMCGIEMRRWIRTALFGLCVLMYSIILSIGYTDIFYKSYYLDTSGKIPILVKDYGFMHTVFYGVVALSLITGIVTIVYSLAKKKQIPRLILLMIIIPDILCTLSYFAGKIFPKEIDFVPLGYVLAEILFLLIAYRRNLYDISDTVIDSMIQEEAVGYISLDFNYRYLGSNDIANELIPELADMAIDEPFGYKPSQRKVRHFIDSFTKERENTFVFTEHSKDGNEDNDKIYNVSVNYLYDASRKRGYIITFTDDTANKKYISLLDSYNENLQQEVDEKTRHIVEMHDNLIMSLAMMVESRDNSTGGHIKRTSEGVRLLVDEILKEGTLPLPEKFCHDIVKAAPMHDLGKIAVDDAILRKPGRFTDEEYDIMKTHAAEGARVIHEILLNTDDESFKVVAENVAHYHHERWDGSGYPEKLSGEDIPIEARIMAIADVYDALVSKRVYKEAFDFQTADKIIMEGMGSQFDPQLKSAYVNARPKLEAYYAEVK